MKRSLFYNFCNVFVFFSFFVFSSFFASFCFVSFVLDSECFIIVIIFKSILQTTLLVLYRCAIYLLISSASVRNLKSKTEKENERRKKKIAWISIFHYCHAKVHWTPLHTGQTLHDLAIKRNLISSFIYMISAFINIWNMTTESVFFFSFFSTWNKNRPIEREWKERNSKPKSKYLNFVKCFAHSKFN